MSASGIVTGALPSPPPAAAAAPDDRASVLRARSRSVAYASWTASSARSFPAASSIEESAAVAVATAAACAAASAPAGAGSFSSRLNSVAAWRF
jgi:hypothetical protein